MVTQRLQGSELGQSRRGLECSRCGNKLASGPFGRGSRDVRIRVMLSFGSFKQAYGTQPSIASESCTLENFIQYYHRHDSGGGSLRLCFSANFCTFTERYTERCVFEMLHHVLHNFQRVRCQASRNMHHARLFAEEKRGSTRSRDLQRLPETPSALHSRGLSATSGSI